MQVILSLFTQTTLESIFIVLHITTLFALAWTSATRVWKLEKKTSPDQIQHGINSSDFRGTARSVNFMCFLSQSRFNADN